MGLRDSPHRSTHCRVTMNVKLAGGVPKFEREVLKKWKIVWGKGETRYFCRVRAELGCYMQRKARAPWQPFLLKIRDTTMSMTAWYYLTDWSRLEEGVRAIDSAEDDLQRYTDGDSPILARVQMPLHENCNAMEAVRAAHEAIAAHLTPTTRRAFEALVASFGILGSGFGDDLGVRRDFLAITISPDRVESTVAALGDANWWEELQEAYVRYHEPDPDWWQGNLDEFLTTCVGSSIYLKWPTPRDMG